jgi:hypothetical protein
VAQRDLPRKTEQHVEPNAYDGRESHNGDDVDVVAVARGDQQTCNTDCKDGSDRRARAHTFFVSAVPNKPSGRNASATMTKAKVTIWL